MEMSQSPSRISRWNVLLIVLAGLASLGTLAPDDSTGRPRGLEVWSGERMAFELIINPAETYVDGFDPEQVHVMDFELFEVPIVTSETAVWTVRVEGNDDFLLTGDFFLEEDGQWTDEDTRMWSLTRDVGTFCLPDSDAETAEDCIPCSLVDGCTLRIEVDRCREVNSQDIFFSVHVQPEGGEYKKKCDKDGDTTPCDILNDWITMGSLPLESSLCGESGE